MQKGRIQDLVIGIVALAIGVAMFLGTKEFPPITQLYCRIVLIILITIGAAMILTSLINAKKPGPEEVHLKEWINPMIIFLIVLVYVFMIDKIGFFVSSAIVMPGIMLFMGYKKPLPMILTTVGMLGFIYILFVTQLKLRMPQGLLF